MSLVATILASDALLPARNQMALSLGWHIILACFGMAFPAMIFVVHRKGLRGDDDFDATVVGLNAVPPDERPPVGVVHLAFQTMVAIGTALVGVVAWFGFRWFRRRDRLFESRRLLRVLVAAGPAAIVAMETGWITTEVGRQPWIVHGLLRTEDAVTDAGYIWVTLAILVLVYGAMTFGAAAVIRSMSRRWRAGERDLISPYGPSLDEAPRGAEPHEAMAAP